MEGGEEEKEERGEERMEPKKKHKMIIISDKPRKGLAPLSHRWWNSCESHVSKDFRIGSHISVFK